MRDLLERSRLRVTTEGSQGGCARRRVTHSDETLIRLPEVVGDRAQERPYLGFWLWSCVVVDSLGSPGHSLLILVLMSTEAIQDLAAAAKNSTEALSSEVILFLRDSDFCSAFV